MSESEKKPIPDDIKEKLVELIKQLEESEDLERPEGGGEIKIKINPTEALWYVAYSTIA